MPDYVTFLASGCFSEQALNGITSLGFDTDRVACRAKLPIGGRLQRAKGVWHLLSVTNFILDVVRLGFLIEWDDELPHVPHDGKNPLATEDRKILDNEVANMLKKDVIRLPDTSIPGVVSGYFAGPKKAKGKLCPIEVYQLFHNIWKFRISTTVKVVRWVRRDYYFTSITSRTHTLSSPSDNIIYEYLTVMFRLRPSARKFTKLMAALIVFLRQQLRILIITYINNLLIQAADEQTCRLHAEITILVLQDLGYGVNFGK